VNARLNILALFATSALVPSSPAIAADLTVTISHIPNTKGVLLLSVVDSEAGWQFQAKPVAQEKLVVAENIRQDKSLQLKFSLPAGQYAVQVVHDENGNGKLDTNFMGIPSEGYGYSNNPVVMRRAYFKETVFELEESPKAIVVRLR
jgi:uncharacterized protein (DUF2141 family)